MSDFKVSVVIPAYNRKLVLARALRSVYAQNLLPYEVIVVDDGSDDGTASWLENDWPQVKLIRQSQRGVSAARNAGIEVAQGDWIALLDSDDEWLPDKLHMQYLALIDHPDARVCHAEEIWMRNGVRVNQMAKHQKFGGWIFQHCLSHCAMSPSSVLLHKSLFDSIGMFNEDLPACEDYDLWLRICSRYPVVFVDEPQVIKYGGHDDQLSMQFWGMDRFRIRALSDLLDAWVLTEEQRDSTVEMLNRKIDMYVKGAMKRGKHDEVDYYLGLKEKHPR